LAGLYSIVGFAAVIDLAVILLVIPGGPPTTLRLAEIAVVFATLIGGVTALLAALPFAVPAAVAVADDGLHFWYSSVYDQRTLREMIPWLDLNIMARTGPSGTDVVTRLVRQFRIDPENARVLASEWSKHRIDRATLRGRAAMPARSDMTPSGPVAQRSVAVDEGTVVSTSGHGAVCARCFIRFPGVEGLRLLWCKVDRFYVCRKCWREGCKEGHGRGTKAVTKPARILSGIVIAVAFLAVWYPMVSYDYTLTSAWRDAPVVAVARLFVGELAKVAGTIRSSQIVAWGGHEIYTDRDGWWWNWNSSDSFRVSDGTGIIDVTTRAYYVGYNGPHPAWYAKHTAMYVYESGDVVQIVGTVIRSANGTPVLEAQIMSMQDASPLNMLAPSALEGLLLTLFPVIMVGLVAGGTALFVSRRLRTRAATEGRPILSLASTGGVRDPDLAWLPNGRGTAPKRRALWAGVSLAVGVATLLVFPGAAPRPEFGYSTLGFFGTLVVMIEGLVVYTILFAGWGRPSFVAVADDGFHMWFESPYDRHLNETLFPWADVRDIHLTGGRTPHWVLNWMTGENTNLYMLKRDNLQLLLTEWTKRKMPST
jgi:hypothetical protein